jgi:hypothetical protein
MKPPLKQLIWKCAALAGFTVAISGQVLAQGDPSAGGMGGGRQRGGFGGGQPVQGIVTAATANSVTIKTDAGDTYVVTPSDTARVMKDREAVKLTDLKPGDSVTAMGTVDASAKTVQAMMVNAIDAVTVQKAKDEMGKSYITGKVTAIDLDNAKLTVMRTDQVSQVIGLDEGTSIQRGARGIQVGLQAMMGGGGRGMGGGRPGGGGGNGAAGAQAAATAPESITLADIKIGDAVVASGALKSGVFTPVKLGVTEPGVAGGGGGRRRSAAGADGQAAPPGAPAPPPNAPPQ